FECDGHRAPVDLGQDVVGQIGHGILRLHPQPQIGQRRFQVRNERQRQFVCCSSERQWTGEADGRQRQRRVVRRRGGQGETEPPRLFAGSFGASGIEQGGRRFLNQRFRKLCCKPCKG